MSQSDYPSDVGYGIVPGGSVTLHLAPGIVALPDHNLEDLILSRSYEAIQGAAIRTEPLRSVAEAFIENMKRVAPTAPRLKDGETLQLDGELCQSLISPVIKSSIELINAVDS